MTLRDFAILALADERARDLPLPELERRLLELAHREAWWKALGPKAKPAAELHGTAQKEPLETGGEISW